MGGPGPIAPATSSPPSSFANTQAPAEPAIMVYYLAENPLPLVSLLGAVALVCLIALKVTQQGKYLVGAGTAITLALAVFLLEQVWVTDNERIEAVVYDMARAVQASDADRVIGHLAPDVTVSMDNQDRLSRSLSRLASLAVRAQIKATLDNTRFDYVRITNLTTTAGAESRLGTAEFRAHAMGSTVTSNGTFNFATSPNGMAWSLGFRETAPNEWKVTRISPINPPADFQGSFGIPK